MVGGEIGGSLDGAVPIHHSKLQIRRRIQPTYPEAAKAMNLGRVDCRVRVFIDETGKPYDVRMHACPKMFHDTTREALYKWRWYPARKDGQKVKVATMLKIRFQTE